MTSTDVYHHSNLYQHTLHNTHSSPLTPHPSPLTSTALAVRERSGGGHSEVGEHKLDVDIAGTDLQGLG